MFFYNIFIIFTYTEIPMKPGKMLTNVKVTLMKFCFIIGFLFGLPFLLGTVQVGIKMATVVLNIVINRKSFFNPSTEIIHSFSRSSVVNFIFHLQPKTFVIMMIVIIISYTNNLGT